MFTRLLIKFSIAYRLVYQQRLFIKHLYTVAHKQNHHANHCCAADNQHPAWLIVLLQSGNMTIKSHILPLSSKILPRFSIHFRLMMVMKNYMKMSKLTTIRRTKNWMTENKSHIKFQHQRNGPACSIDRRIFSLHEWHMVQTSTGVLWPDRSPYQSEYVDFVGHEISTIFPQKINATSSILSEEKRTLLAEIRQVCLVLCC